MSSKYERIWEALKKAQTEPNQWVEVKVASADTIPTIISVVQNVKSRANVSRKRLDLPAYGKLEIRRLPKERRVLFRLTNSGDAL